MADEEKKDAPTGDSFACEERVGGEEAKNGERAESPAETVERLTRELEERTSQAVENYDLYLRERAELENFKKRLQRDKTEALRFASEALIRDLLPVLDNLERAVEHADSGGNDRSLVEGVKMVLKSAMEVLQNYGVSRVEAIGQPFDPSHHEAVLQVTDSGRQPNHVVEQFLPGYCLHERLLRAAQVSVSGKAPVEKGENDD